MKPSELQKVKESDESSITNTEEVCFLGLAPNGCKYCNALSRKKIISANAHKEKMDSVLVRTENQVK